MARSLIRPLGTVMAALAGMSCPLPLTDHSRSKPRTELVTISRPSGLNARPLNGPAPLATTDEGRVHSRTVPPSLAAAR